MSTKRLFIGIPVPPKIRHHIHSMTELPGCYRITRSENLHFTLFFLGDVEQRQIDTIGSELADICALHSQFNLGIDCFGQFPQHGPARIIFVHGERGRKQLTLLGDSVRKGVGPLGFINDKPFSPHMTIARLSRNKKSEPGMVLPDPFDELLFNVSSVVLYESRLKSEGPTYTPLWTISLT